MAEILNQVFFGCNYNDKKIKAQFDKLKERIQENTALSCIIVDKRRGKPAFDLWKEIKQQIEQSSACVFDVTGFRPNVILELGYALSIKNEDQIFITFRKRKSKGKVPQWILKDIDHLNRFEYVNIMQLEEYIREQLQLIPYSQSFNLFIDACNTTSTAEKYQECGLSILRNIRDSGPRSKQQLKRIMYGTQCRYTQMIGLLKRAGLTKQSQGRNGKFRIPIVD